MNVRPGDSVKQVKCSPGWNIGIREPVRDATAQLEQSYQLQSSTRGESGTDLASAQQAVAPPGRRNQRAELFVRC
jgi:hypothetical protein